MTGTPATLAPDVQSGAGSRPADPTPEPIVVGEWTFTRGDDDDYLVVDHPAYARGARHLPRSALTALFGEVERLRSKVGPDRDDRPDGALCWDPDGPDGGAWVLRGRDVPDGWRWWFRLDCEGPSDLRPGLPDGLYWALPPEPEPATERVSLWRAIGRTPDHCPNDRIIEVGLDGDGPWFCTGPSIEPEYRDYAVADDGTVEVLAEDGDQ